MSKPTSIFDLYEDIQKPHYEVVKRPLEKRPISITKFKGLVGVEEFLNNTVLVADCNCRKRVVVTLHIDTCDGTVERANIKY